MDLNYIKKPYRLKYGSKEMLIKLKNLNKLKILFHLQNIILCFLKLKLKVTI